MKSAGLTALGCGTTTAEELRSTPSSAEEAPAPTFSGGFPNVTSLASGGALFAAIQTAGEQRPRRSNSSAPQESQFFVNGWTRITEPCQTNSSVDRLRTNVS